ncbi:MAG TPA: hypothetical protein VK585_14935 [Jiangellaceae bacterium]|nr:hypothetical protein [Jiangellaceae bacterium]
MRLTAIAFFALAACIAVDSVRALVWAKRRVGRELGSATVGRGLGADPALHLPVHGTARRHGAQRDLGLVVGRYSGLGRRRRGGRREGVEAWRGDN